MSFLRSVQLEVGTRSTKHFVENLNGRFELVAFSPQEWGTSEEGTDEK